MVGAITNGLGSPTEIPELSDFFAFSVSAEEEPLQSVTHLRKLRCCQNSVISHAPYQEHDEHAHHVARYLIQRKLSQLNSNLKNPEQSDAGVLQIKSEIGWNRQMGDLILAAGDHFSSS